MEKKQCANGMLKYIYTKNILTQAKNVEEQSFECLNDGFVCCKHAAFHFTIHELMNWSHLWIIVLFLSAV